MAQWLNYLVTIVNPAFEEAWQGGSYTSCNIETQTGFWNFGGHAEQNQYINLWFLTLLEVLGIHWCKLLNGVILSMYVSGGRRFSSRISKHQFVLDVLNDEKFLS